MTASTARASEQLPARDADGVRLALRPDTSLALAPDLRPSGLLELGGLGDGAVIRLKQGSKALLRISNDTQQKTGVALVGMRSWGAAGLPSTLALQGIAPGTAATLPLDLRDSGTTLLRAVPSPGNETQRGAAGVLVIEEATAPDVDSDRVLLLQDWLLGADGQLRFGSSPPPDAVQRIVTVNRRAAPQQATLAPRARVRLRLVNGSTQRVMLVACEGVTPTVMAIDGQPCGMFAPARGTVPIGPGARFDLMADLPDAPGLEARVVLRGTERLAGMVEPDRTLLILRTEGAPREKRPAISPLPSNPALPQAIPLEAAKRLDLAFAKLGDRAGSWTVNGVASGAAPLLTVRQGDAVTLGFNNTSALLTPVRVQGQVLRVLHARDDGWDPYWRDSILLPPLSRAHVAFVAGSPGRWAVESGFDDQLLAGLRCWFSVTPR